MNCFFFPTEMKNEKMYECKFVVRIKRKKNHDLVPLFEVQKCFNFCFLKNAVLLQLQYMYIFLSICDRYISNIFVYSRYVLVYLNLHQMYYTCDKDRLF